MSAGDQQQESEGHGEPSGEDDGSARGLDELAQELVNLARSLEAEDETNSMLADLVAAAIAQVPGAEEGSVSMVTGRGTSFRRAQPASCRSGWTRYRPRPVRAPV